MTAWNPWRALRERDHIEFALVELAAGDAIYARADGVACILIERRLDTIDRNAVLTHELIHDERAGGADHPGMPASWQAVVARDEAIVDAEVARRLVDPDELVEFIGGRLSIGEAVEARAVADWFDVPLAVADRALHQLAG